MHSFFIYQINDLEIPRMEIINTNDLHIEFDVKEQQIGHVPSQALVLVYNTYANIDRYNDVYIIYNIYIYMHISNIINIWRCLKIGYLRIIHLYMDFPLYTIQLLGYLHLWEPPYESDCVKGFCGDLTSLSYLDTLSWPCPLMLRGSSRLSHPRCFWLVRQL